MHGYFVAQTLYEEAKLISDPFILDAQREKKVRERVEKERESRIRGSKKIPGQVNRALAEQLLERDEKVKNRDLENEEMSISQSEEEGDVAENSHEDKPRSNLLSDPRFSKLFTVDDFAIDETSREWQQLNPGSAAQPAATAATKQVGLTAVEREELQDISGSSTDESEDDEEDRRQGKNKQSGKAARGDRARASNGDKNKGRIAMSVQDSFRPREARDRSFGSRTSRAKEPKRRVGGAAGERETTFIPEKFSTQAATKETPKNHKNSRRSASGNVFRRM